MKKNSLKIKNVLVNFLIDHKIEYRVTDKSVIVPFENGDSVDREPKWFKDFRIKQEAFNGEVATFIKEQKNFNEKVDVRLEKIENRLDSLEYKVDAILECPTIKKEIKL